MTAAKEKGPPCPRCGVAGPPLRFGLMRKDALAGEGETWIWARSCEPPDWRPWWKCPGCGNEWAVGAAQ